MLNAELVVSYGATVIAGHTLALATAELRKSPASPQRLWEFETALWDFNRYAMGVDQRDVVVADCPWTKDQMEKFMGLGVMGRLKRLTGNLEPDFGLFLPQVASTAPEGLRLLDRVYPSMRWTAQNVPAFVKNEDSYGQPVELHGWLRTEQTINAPLRGRTEAQARTIVLERHRRQLTLNAYGVAGEQSRLLNKKMQFLDQVRTWTWVLNSRVGGRVVVADFYPVGGCDVDWGLGPVDVREGLRVRSVGV